LAVKGEKGILGCERKKSNKRESKGLEGGMSSAEYAGMIRELGEKDQSNGEGSRRKG